MDFQRTQKLEKNKSNILYKDEKGNNINISLIGFFKIEQLEKEFIMYSIIDDDKNNLDGYILLGEVLRNNDSIQILGIKENEKELVLAYYNEISKQLGEDDNE